MGSGFTAETQWIGGKKCLARLAIFPTAANPLDTASAPVALARPEVGTMEERRERNRSGAVIAMIFVVIPAACGFGIGVSAAMGWAILVIGAFCCLFASVA